MKHESIATQPRSSRSIIAILTILIHLLFLLLLIIPYTPLCINKELEQKLEQLHQKIHKQDPQDPWVTVNPAVSNAGAPVILVDDDDQPQNAPHSNKPDTTTQSKEPNDTKQAKETQEAIETDVDIPQEFPESRADDDQPTTTPQPKKQAQKYDPNYVPASLFKKDPATKAHSAKTATHKKPRTAKKQPLTITQLVDDFDKHMHQDEHNTQTSSLSLSMMGQASNNAKMTERQLKEGRFMEKLAHCIIAAWRAHAKECPLAPETIAIHIELVIATNGSITNVSILKSSRLRAVDQFVTRIMHSAGKSFPPLPSFLATNAYHIRCYLDGINPRQGPYRLVASQ